MLGKYTPFFQLVEFKVMVRPLKAVNLLHARMRAMLEEMSGN